MCVRVCMHIHVYLHIVHESMYERYATGVREGGTRMCMCMYMCDWDESADTHEIDWPVTEVYAVI